MLILSLNNLIFNKMKNIYVKPTLMDLYMKDLKKNKKKMDKEVFIIVMEDFILDNGKMML